MAYLVKVDFRFVSVVLSVTKKRQAFQPAAFFDENW
jgi:hypothetical protein